MNIGNLIVNVIARTSGFQSGMRKSRKELGTFDRAARQTRRTVGSMKAALATVGIGFTMSRVVAGLRDTAREIDSLAKTSDKLGITTERLAGLHLAGDLTGNAAKTLDMGLQRMVRRIAEAAAGGGEAAGAIKELGLNARELNRMSPDKQFAAIAGQMAKVTTQADRVRLSFKLFDSEGVALVNTLRLGERGLERVHQQAKQLGIAIDRETAGKVEHLNDQLRLLGAQWEGTKAAILIDITPAASRAVTALGEVLGGSAAIAGEGKNKAARFNWGKYFGDQFRYTGAAARWAKNRFAGKEATDRAVRRFGMPDISGQTDFTARLEAKAKRWKEGPGKGLGISYADFVRNNTPSLEERMRYNPAAEARVNSGLFKAIRSKIPDLSDEIMTGFRKLDEGIKAAEKIGQDWQKANPLARIKGNPLYQAIRDRWKLPPLIEPKAEKKTTSATARDTNAALIKGTLEAFTAARANLLPKQQLDETKKQTRLLASMDRKIGSGGLVEVGIA